ncbi:hypothetical protein GCM10010191_88940 [Actinomadura vinacea]|uniref:Uncharacterized protein n=1 Tax=Actinomadura vinacea TaxID=115336 RepID=A0ABN3KFJ7_9ACTN
MSAQEQALNEVDTIDIPLPATEEQRELVLAGASLEIEEISADAGHFSSSYRRC